MRVRSRDRQRSAACPPTAFTLVEVLVALAIAALLATALLAAVRGSGRAASLVSDRAEAGGAGALATALLRFELEGAGRGREEDGLRVVLDPAGAGGDVFSVRYLAEAHRVEPVEVDASFFAARDSQGRPNLYRRPRDGIRQPWLLGVTGLHLVAGIGTDGRTVPRAELQPRAPLAGLVVEIRLADREPVRLTADTSRAGPVGVELAP